jgi:hypothetical protein
MPIDVEHLIAVFILEKSKSSIDMYLTLTVVMYEM